MIIKVAAGQSIQQAVNDADPGDTILVQPGIFRENVLVNKDRLRIIGAGIGRSILDGTGLAGENGFTVVAGATTIAGFTVGGFRADGIQITSSDNVIRHNELTRNGDDGIQIEGDRNLIAKNRVWRNRFGIYIPQENSSNYVIDNRSWRHTFDGLLIGGENTLILENKSWRNRDTGIYIFGDGCWVLNNEVKGNTGEGISVHAAHVLVYANKSMNNATGVSTDTAGLLALRNVLTENTNAGLAVAAATCIAYANRMIGNRFAGFDGREAIETNLVVRNHSEENGDAGIYVEGNENRVLFNEVERNASTGIAVIEASARNLIDNNRVERNRFTGIFLAQDTTDNAVRGNKLKRNTPVEIFAVPPADANNIFELNK